MPVQEHLSLQQALINALRRIRHDRGWSQDRLAELGRLHGLSWTRSTVSDLEAVPRRRDFSIDELVLLPDVLDVSYDELAEDIVTHEEKGALLDADRALIRWVTRSLPGGKTKQIDARFRRLQKQLARHLYASAEDLALRQAEKNAARALGVDALEVATAALRLWGHGVTEERDRRVDETPGEGDRSRRLSHATRRLIEELRDEIGGER